jgi:alkanesulfonate monooxygenase SsuD/methylene tetrahydromethanopterin reductase-like flavin-dependent oxidoreductase (luciferase family)
MTGRKALFGFGLETGLGEVGALLEHATQADREGLDLVTLSDHPYFADRLDAYAALGVVLGRTTDVTEAVNVTNLPTRPAPMLARTITALSALSRGRVVLGIGAGGLWDDIARLGAPRRSPAAAVRAMAEAITLVRMLSGGGGPVTFDGEFYQVTDLVPAPVPTPPIWTGALGPKSLAVTGQLADGWIPGYAADWRSPRFARSRPLTDKAAVDAGRDPTEVATIYNLPGRITTVPLPAARDEDGRWIGGSIQQWTDELVSAVLDHSAAGFVYFRSATAPQPTSHSAGGPARSRPPSAKHSARSESGTVAGPGLGRGLSGRAEPGADLVGGGRVELSEDDLDLPPGVAGRLGIAGAVVKLAEVGQGAGLAEAVAELAEQLEGVPVAVDGLRMVAEVLVDVAEA